MAVNKGIENTLAAFGHAVEVGCTYLETDVHATSDGVLVAFHDPILDRVTESGGVIAAMPWHKVKQAKVGGEPIPTLDEIFDAFPEAFINIDIKAANHLEQVPASSRATAGTKFRVPYARTKAYQRSFFPDTARMWNNLPCQAANIQTVGALRDALSETCLRV